jgi:hypothetical protein
LLLFLVAVQEPLHTAAVLGLVIRLGHGFALGVGKITRDGFGRRQEEVGTVQRGGNDDIERRAIISRALAIVRVSPWTSFARNIATRVGCGSVDGIPRHAYLSHAKGRVFAAQRLIAFQIGKLIFIVARSVAKEFIITNFGALVRASVFKHWKFEILHRSFSQIHRVHVEFGGNAIAVIGLVVDISLAVADGRVGTARLVVVNGQVVEFAACFDLAVASRNESILVAVRHDRERRATEDFASVGEISVRGGAVSFVEVLGRNSGRGEGCGGCHQRCKKTVE